MPHKFHLYLILGFKIKHNLKVFHLLCYFGTLVSVIGTSSGLFFRWISITARDQLGMVKLNKGFPHAAFSYSIKYTQTERKAFFFEDKATKIKLSFYHSSCEIDWLNSISFDEEEFLN